MSTPVCRKTLVPTRWLVGAMIGCGCCLALSLAHAYLLDKDPDADTGVVWDKVEKNGYQLWINMCAGARLYPNDQYDLPVTLPLLMNVQGKGNVGPAADLGNGRGAWERIQGRRKETEQGSVVMLNGLLMGLRVEQTLTATDGTLAVDYRVRVETPVPEINRCFFGPVRFARRPEGLVFSAETQDGKKMSGDLCTAFEAIKSLKRLEVRTAHRLVVYDFDAVAGVELESAGTPRSHPTAAMLMIWPVGVQPQKIGEVFGYRLTITVSPVR